MSLTLAMNNKNSALALASLGLHIFPCNPDKTPKVAAWEQTASASPFDIAVKWDDAPDSLPGLLFGAHGLVVIDAVENPGGPDGVAAFVALCAKQGIDLSGAFVVETPSSGLHFYFSTTTRTVSSGFLPKGIDVRGKGGYVIGPGATLPDGRSYRIVGGSWDTDSASTRRVGGFPAGEAACDPFDAAQWRYGATSDRQGASLCRSCPC